MLNQKMLMNFRMGWEALLTNKMRALLTSLGIIFGVAAVISMMAIGKGTEIEIIKQLKEVGSNNIIIKRKEIEQDPSAAKTEETEKKQTSEGLTLKDAYNIQQTIPAVKNISPEAEFEGTFLNEGRRMQGKIVGVTNFYFELTDLKLDLGKIYSQQQSENAEPVCIIGNEVKNKLFPGRNCLGEKIKCGTNWLTIVGVLSPKSISEKSMAKLSIRDPNKEVYVPIETFLLRYFNRSLVTIGDMERASNMDNSERENEMKKNYHQLDRLVVHIDETAMMQPAAETIDKILQRRHNGFTDYEIILPELILKQEQKTKKIFNLVLGVIAGISLLVGGIGIMNIMLASVLERIREIGLRQSLGATRKDVIWQFMSEAIIMSIGGGTVGVILGVALSILISKAFDLTIFITFTSIIISFTISVLVGLLFGIWPARKAAMQNPVESLRHD
jgi:putative ABC transport system permease protein